MTLTLLQSDQLLPLVVLLESIWLISWPSAQIFIHSELPPLFPKYLPFRLNAMKSPGVTLNEAAELMSHCSQAPLRVDLSICEYPSAGPQ